jgi:dGTPase
MSWINYFKNAKNRLYSDNKNENFRSEFQIDYDRIVFSSAFRRLQNKTQVLPFPKSDYVRNRLTHSLETASVGRSLGNIVGKKIVEKYPDLQEKLQIHPTDFGHLVSAACLTHDIGNPPFGHAGEAAISSYFKSEKAQKHLKNLTDKQLADLQSFEGNASGLRIVAQTLRNQSDIKGGLRLTLGTYATFAKYPKESLPVRKKEEKASLKKFGIYQSEMQMFANEIAQPLNMIDQSNKAGIAFKRFPLTYLVEAADDICYHIIDFEDGFNIGFISFDTIEKAFSSLIEWDESSQKRYQQIYSEREKVNYLRSLSINTLVQQCATIFINKEDEFVKGNLDTPLLDLLSKDLQIKLESIIKQSIDKIYQSEPVLKIEAAGMKVLPNLLDKFVPATLNPKQNKVFYKLIAPEYREGESDYEKILNVTMFVSNMTDRQAVELYKNINGIELAGY